MALFAKASLSDLCFPSLCFMLLPAQQSTPRLLRPAGDKKSVINVPATIVEKDGCINS